MTERIGIIGASGDLGQRLTVQACATHEVVFTFDINNQPISQDAVGVDESLTRTQMKSQPVRTLGPNDVLANADIIHCAAPATASTYLPSLGPDKVLILHDSVMDLSRRAVEERRARDLMGRTAIVHCLMNNHNRVVIADESEAADEALKHFTNLGLNPLLQPLRRHDQIMAESQAPMALLHELFADQLASYAEHGLLTPSGEDFTKALNARAAKWTDTTLQTLLRNPELPQLIELMRQKTNGRMKK